MACEEGRVWLVNRKGATCEDKRVWPVNRMFWLICLNSLNAAC